MQRATVSCGCELSNKPVPAVSRRVGGKKNAEENTDMAETKPTPVVNVQSTIDDMVARAQKALDAFMLMDQKQVDDIVQAMALAGLEAHMRLAKLAIEETKRGVYEDKITKNL